MTRPARTGPARTGPARTGPARTGLVGLIAFGLLSVVPLVSGAGPAQAATTTTTVNYTRCDVRTAANDPSTRVGPVFAWSPTITVDVDTPVELKSEVDVRFSMSDFPASRIPVGMPTPYTYYTTRIGSTDGDTYFGKTIRAAQPAGQPIVLGEAEDDYTFHKPGLVAWTAGEFTMSTEGYDGPNNTGTWGRYYVKCDKPTTPVRIATIPVWDPAAKAAVSLSASKLVQGSAIRVTGAGFRPDEAVQIKLGKAVLATNATSLTGGVTHRWTAGAFQGPGKYTFTLTSTVSAKTVQASFTVVPAAGKTILKPNKIKVGKATAVTGRSFKPGEKVTVVLTRTSSGKGLKKLKLATLTANKSGQVSKKFAVSKKFTAGKHRVTLTGLTSKRAGAAALTITK